MGVLPASTYRLQFHKDFTVADLKDILPYLEKLGIGAVYASPVFASVPGSLHGYDGINPVKPDPEITSEEELQSVSRLLKSKHILWIQDIVPNHLAFHPANEWLMDYFFNGHSSAYTGYFDMLAENNNGRIMAPFLDKHLDEAVAAREIRITSENRKFFIEFPGHRFPLWKGSYDRVFKRISEKRVNAGISDVHESEAGIDRSDYKLTGDTKIPDLNELNIDKEVLKQLLDEQLFELCHWREADDRINYRRFFTINGLICLRMENDRVFDAFHSKISRFIHEDIFDGLRIDHIDGLYHPGKYLDRLRELAGDEKYIVVEKILEPGETLPASWPVEGTTGYEFIFASNSLFAWQGSANLFRTYYDRLTGNFKPASQRLREKKSLILFNHMKGELNYLSTLFRELLPAGQHFEEEEIKATLAEFLIECPVYKVYPDTLPLTGNDREIVSRMFQRMKEREIADRGLIVVLEDMFIGKPGDEKALHFFRRCMQFTGPLMAKGAEDTFMYTYAKLIAHNEVGDSPESAGFSAGKFHRFMLDRNATLPHSMNTSSTHDTKRGEDARARLLVLTAIPEKWFAKVSEWVELNKIHKPYSAPDINEEYFIYQTITGTLPMPGTTDPDYLERISAYATKAFREAKRNTDWTEPDIEYEKATLRFLATILDPAHPFRKSVEEFVADIADFGIQISLSQLLLKFTSPGIPDTYQGTELWDLSFVDPDNRRAVDYEKRKEILDSFDNCQNTSLIGRLRQQRYEGDIKLWLTSKLMHVRKNHADVFHSGSYIPLEVSGKYHGHVAAFAREHKGKWFISVCALYLAALMKNAGEIDTFDWEDTEIQFKGELPVLWTDWAGERIVTTDGRISLNDVFRNFTFNLLMHES